MLDKILAQCNTNAEMIKLLSEQNKLIVGHINVVSELVKANIGFGKDIADEIIKSQTAMLVGFNRLGTGDLSEYVLKKKEKKPDAGHGEVCTNHEAEEGRGSTSET